MRAQQRVGVHTRVHSAPTSTRRCSHACPAHPRAPFRSLWLSLGLGRFFPSPKLWHPPPFLAFLLFCLRGETQPRGVQPPHFRGLAGPFSWLWAHLAHMQNWGTRHCWDKDQVGLGGKGKPSGPQRAEHLAWQDLCPPVGETGGLPCPSPPPAARSPTCSARVVGHSERVPVLLGVHREQAHAEVPVASIGCAIVEVLQVHMQLVGCLCGQCMEPFEPWVGERMQEMLGDLEGDPTEGTREK